MPIRPPKPCSYPGCVQYALPGTSRCAEHKIKPWQHKKGSRHERGYGSKWDKLRKVIMYRDNGLCQVCLKAGYVTQAVAVDHIIPKAQGGTDAESNLQAICKQCHDKKTEAEKKWKG